ncbi:osomolarity two-component system response regulator SSK1 [Fusarium beomiforme]|uniref:Osomolarity two-component system response regulator SSK1 n=1 Tax=Fusarium beomiforme TaxID=44412 RepID=A0A9P5ADJ6_9HYPO|nr:osomolarity two-component system response regulator SSK1 [Fusarium beomiforme]
MGATDIASRLRAKFTKRRHSTAGSHDSSTRSFTDTTSSSFGSRHLWDRDRDRARDGDGDRSSQRAVSNSRGTVSSRRGQTATPDGSHRQREEGDDLAKLEVSEAANSDPNSNPESAAKSSSEIGAEAAVPPANDNSTAPNTASEPLKQLSPPMDQQSLDEEEPDTTATSSSDQLPPHSDLHPPQPAPRLQLNSPPLISPSLHPPEQSSPSRLRQASSNLDLIHEDSQDSEPSSPTARPRKIASLELDAGSELAGRNDDDPLSLDQAPNSPKPAAFAPLAAATSTTFVAPSPGLPHSGAISTPGSPSRPAPPPRRQSLLSNRQTTLINTLLSNQSTNETGYIQPNTYAPINGNMVTRKIWVKRPHASPTLVTVNEDDLVDDVRDMILRKYSNSLGRTFDSPDINIRIIPRDQHPERILNPEEPMGRTLDAYYPGGQTVEEALVIDIPRRAPKASPRPVVPAYVGNVYYSEDGRPTETSDGYFPSVAAHPGAVGSPHLPVAVPAHVNPQAPHSIAVLGTGHIPPIPSPGRSRAYRDRPDRPRLGRTHTSSPTLIANGSSVSLAAAAAANHASHGTQHFNPRLPHSRTHSSSSDAPGMPPAAPPLPTPPAPEPSTARVSTPPVRPASPRPTAKTKKSKKAEHPSLPPGMLNGGVPPINVLIVEDNPINLKLLEAFVKRLKVRWSTAMNGRDAVKKWRSGGFHLVLMDIQLPVMNGLDATREIRRLERVNSIGVFSSSPDGVVTKENPDELDDKDRLENPSLFKSPVIIVALTASSLQSDRHEALAAGCNDFLTKPVNFVWLERKVMEWGCMQALIDFDGWRKWKEISQEAEENEAAKKAAVAAAKAKSKKNRLSMSKPG